MQDVDLFAFMAIFRDLLKVFPKSRTADDDVDPLARSYFRALQRFSVADIQAGADAWVQRGKFFPKPAEWRESIPRRGVAERAELVPLTPTEATEYLDAERRGYEGEPCGCRRCVGAGVSHRFPRYVPEQDEQDRDMRGLIGQRVVVRGRWIHGDELRRWYETRDAYLALKTSILSSKSMPKVTPAEMEPHPYRDAV